ncbi:MAG: single-stranded DNA-binding protein [Bacteroidales bacterium]|nr:single-stranded DNA-binding protein [Bacteroidales bacterium]
MSVNKVILVGNVGKDPEVKYLDKGNVVASFSLATTERGYTTSAGVVIPERTEWHNIVMWRGLAEIAEKYVKKGSQIYLEGKIRTRNYDDQNGVKRYVTEVFADNMQLLGKREGGDHSAVQAPAHEASTPTAHEPAADFSTNAPTDDLPF